MSRQIALQWFEEVWNKKDRSAVFRLLADNVVDDTEGGPIVGAEQFASVIFDGLLQAFPDLTVKVERVVAEGDQATTLWTAVATHAGQFLDIPKTGRRVSFKGMTWMRFEGDKIVEGVDRYNLHALIECLRHGSVAPTVQLMP